MIINIKKSRLKDMKTYCNKVGDRGHFIVDLLESLVDKVCVRDMHRHCIGTEVARMPGQLTLVACVGFG